MFSNTWELPAAVQINVDPFMIFMICTGIAASVPWAEILRRAGQKEKFAKVACALKSERSKGILLTVSLLLTVALMGVCMLALASSAYNPFIYFRF